MELISSHHELGTGTRGVPHIIGISNRYTTVVSSGYRPYRSPTVGNLAKQVRWGTKFGVPGGTIEVKAKVTVELDWCTERTG